MAADPEKQAGTEEQEAPAPVAEQAEAAEDASSEAPKRAKRVPKPSVEDLKAKVGALEEQISRHKARIDGIRSELDSRTRRRQQDTESQGIRNQLQELRTQFQQVLAQKQSARSELDSATKARDALRMQVKGMKGKMEYTTVEKIDEQTARLEQRLQHTSMPLAEEKRVLEDIKKLRASRASVAQYNEKLERLNGDDDCRTIVDRLKALDEQLSNIKTQEEGLRKQLTDIRAKEDERNVDVPKMQKERDECREVIRAAVDKIKELRAEYKAKQEEWWQGEVAWREQRARDKARKDEEYAAIRAQRDAERKARAKELAGEPYNKEVTLCEQVQAYLSRFLSDQKAEEKAEQAEIKPLEGMQIYSKKNVEDENPYATVEKKKKGKKGAKNSNSAPADKSLNHGFDILGAFSKLKVEAPLKASKVPDTVEAVKERLAYYLKKREEAKANGEEEAAETDAPVAAPAAAKQAAQNEYVGGGDEPTPAEAAGGRAAAPGSTPANGIAEAWGGSPATATNGDVSVGLKEGDDGNVAVSITVGEGR